MQCRLQVLFMCPGFKLRVWCDTPPIFSASARKPPRFSLVRRSLAAVQMPNPRRFQPAESSGVRRRLQVSPAATWARKQHRLQWRLPVLAPGEAGELKAYFEPDAGKDPAPDSLGRFGGLTAAAVEEAVLRCGPTPRPSLGG